MEGIVSLFARIFPGFRFTFFLLLLLVCFFASIVYGTKPISYPTIYSSFVAFNNDSEDHVIIQAVRLPRALIALAVGACLGVSGAIMQALTRNPLASPELLGMNHGAGLGVVCSLLFFPASSTLNHIWFAFLGAGLAACLVYIFSTIGKNGMTPVKLTLAGASLTTLLVSITQALLILSERSFDEMRFWLAGSVSGRSIELFLDILPFMLFGLIIALFIAKKIEVLVFGEEIATGLGQRTAWVKVTAMFAVVLLAGSAVSIAGPISFIGLAVPHLARSLAGANFRWIFIYSAVLGATLLLLADTAARFVIYPQDLPVGIMTAILGAPFFIYIGRKKDWKL